MRAKTRKKECNENERKNKTEKRIARRLNMQFTLIVYFPTIHPLLNNS